MRQIEKYKNHEIKTLFLRHENGETRTLLFLAWHLALATYLYNIMNKSILIRSRSLSLYLFFPFLLTMKTYRLMNEKIPPDMKSMRQFQPIT